MELVLRTFHPGQSLTAIAEQMLAFIGGLGIPVERMPPIVLLEDRSLSRPQMRDLYRSTDVLVAPSRGEGYGRPLLEALSCGVPVIATRWGGQTDFVTEENGWLVDYHLTLADPSENPLFRGKAWADPSVEHMRYCLREAFEQTELRQRKAEHASSSVARYDQESVADLLVERLKQIGAAYTPKSQMTQMMRVSPRESAKSVDGIMLTSPHQRCGIREYAVRLMESGLEERMRLLSCPDLFRSFNVNAELLHLQYHPAFVNPHQFVHHPPKGRLIATIHELQRFEEISHRFDVITVHNERDYRRVLTMPRKSNAEVLIIPHGCCQPAAERFEPSTRSDPVIAYHGFLSPHKGLKELIQGFAQFLKFYARSRLLVVATLNAFNDLGGQLCLHECQQVVRELGLTNHATFVTEFLPMDDIIALLHQEADLIVLPYVVSGDSGSSGAIRIAMASGKPVLASGLFDKFFKIVVVHG